MISALRSMGLFWLKTPAELGGTPMAPLDFCDVMEELAYADSSTAWTVMVGNCGTGTAGGWLPDAGAHQVFAPGRPLPLVVGTPGPRGTGRPVPGGYVVTGRWGFASGIAYCDWLLAASRSRHTRDGMLESVHIAVAAASVYAVETCAEVIADLFRYGGGPLLSLTSPVQRNLRDCLAARQHIGVSEENYERAGRHRIQTAWSSAG